MTEGKHEKECKLIFNGPRDDSPDTLRNIKGVLLADLNLSVEEVQNILQNAPQVIIQSDEKESLIPKYKLLHSAGALVTIQNGEAVSDESADDDEEFVMEFSLEDLEAEEELSAAKKKKSTPRVFELSEDDDLQSASEMLGATVIMQPPTPESSEEGPGEESSDVELDLGGTAADESGELDLELGTPTEPSDDASLDLELPGESDAELELSISEGTQQEASEDDLTLDLQSSAEEQPATPAEPDGSDELSLELTPGEPPAAEPTPEKPEEPADDSALYLQAGDEPAVEMKVEATPEEPQKAEEEAKTEEKKDEEQPKEVSEAEEKERKREEILRSLEEMDLSEVPPLKTYTSEEEGVMPVTEEVANIEGEVAELLSEEIPKPKRPKVVLPVDVLIAIIVGAVILTVANLNWLPESGEGVSSADFSSFNPLSFGKKKKKKKKKGGSKKKKIVEDEGPYKPTFLLRGTSRHAGLVLNWEFRAKGSRIKEGSINITKPEETRPSNEDIALNRAVVWLHKVIATNVTFSPEESGGSSAETVSKIYAQQGDLRKRFVAPTLIRAIYDREEEIVEFSFQVRHGINEEPEGETYWASALDNGKIQVFVDEKFSVAVDEKVNEDVLLGVKPPKEKKDDSWLDSIGPEAEFSQ